MTHFVHRKFSKKFEPQSKLLTYRQKKHSTTPIHMQSKITEFLTPMYLQHCMAQFIPPMTRITSQHLGKEVGNKKSQTQMAPTPRSPQLTQGTSNPHNSSVTKSSPTTGKQQHLRSGSHLNYKQP